MLPDIQETNDDAGKRKQGRRNAQNPRRLVNTGDGEQRDGRTDQHS